MIRKLLFFALLCLMAGAPARAFPPAPYYTLYGTVRDQVGQTITAQGAEIILLKGAEELGRTPIDSTNRLEQNYELRIRLDHNRSGTTIYSEKAVAAQGLFSLAVEMNGSRYYPIEVTGNLTAGKGGETVRLDLNLGEDLDGDGLPDVWEAWQLYQAGYLPDGNGNWPLDLLSRNGDFDRDGLTDWFEYVAGTFAGDATERFSLEIKEKLAASVRFEFYAITGKTYTIEKSADMKDWAQVPFALDAPGSGLPAQRSTEVGIRSAFAVPTAVGTKEFYRLTVR